MKTPLVVLQGIWKKATDLINDPLKISPAPGCSPHARMVESKTGKRPHLVTSGKSGKFMCDSDCPNFKSLGICSHVVSTAEVNSQLPSFIDYFKKQNKAPNVSVLAKTDLPRGQGRKGGAPPRKRKKMGTPESRIPFNPAPVQTTPVSYNPTGTGSPILQSSSPQSGHFGTPSAAAAAPSSAHAASCPPGAVLPPNAPPPFRPSAQPPSVASTPLARIRNVNARGVSGNVFVSQVPAAHSETRPFNLHFIKGNISRCAGCKGQYVKPAVPPWNLCIQHEEWRQVTFPNSPMPSSVFSNVYYHASLPCVRVNWPSFLPVHLMYVPLFSQLTGYTWQIC